MRGPYPEPMEAGRLARWRWRRRGAWLWPAFVVLTLLDGEIGHALPAASDSQDYVGAALIACFANLFGIVVLAWPVSLMLRRRRPSLPRVVARDQAGTAVLGMIAAALLAAGLVHHSALVAERAIEQDAITRAQAYIGDHAPAEFRRNLSMVDTYAIEPGRIYRECVPSALGGPREYCVVVRSALPLARSVTFAGYEPNSVFSQGTR